MSESPEFIGSMPSVPQHQLPPPVPEQKPKADNRGAFIGFFLCAVCLFGFPSYAQTDDLGTGIFYGMGLFLLLIAFSGLLGILVKRGSKDRPPKARPAPRKPRRVRQLNGILFGIVILLLGVYLLTSPDLVDINIFGLFFLIVGIGVIFFAIVGIFRSRRRLAEFESGAGSAARSQQTKSQILLSGLYMLFAGACLFVFPRIMGANAFVRGFLYGIGLIILMLAMLVLGNALSMRRSAPVSPGQ
jgi:MFS family permease